MQPENKHSTVIVTGASRGIGAATALLLAECGYSVAVNYAHSRAQAEAIVERIQADGGRAAAIQADMGVEADVLRLFDEAERALGPVTALVNNAAVNLRDGDGSVEQLSWESAARVMAVNVVGPMVACREALKRMKRHGGGAIVNVTSEAAKFGGNRISAYASSKAAMNTFTVGFAREAAAHGVRVNAVSPGVIATDAHADASPERLAGLKNSIPLGRLGEPEEVARAVAWLLSAEASYVSGSILTVAGAR